MLSLLMGLLTTDSRHRTMSSVSMYLERFISPRFPPTFWVTRY